MNLLEIFWMFLILLPGALKQYYISKRCATKDKCERYRSSNMGSCTHIWYEDWKCSECCKGDRCNYYIIVSLNIFVFTLSSHLKYSQFFSRQVQFSAEPHY
ncbi:hypothetical protein D910_01143 [Dendroctonus ponderosae]|uniref:Uncharacterized protein n=1 Tax=Dendroctonus ponderosae TaxID=77166 RepID=U4TVA7_DENPD|nr:hypothetical protein D910_01143 [Dendroctonus ponderosae]